MLHFNELRITQDDKYLIIDASVDNQDFYDDIILDSVVIDTQDTYVPNGPSSNPVYKLKVADAYDLTYSLPEECSCNPVLEEEDKSYCFTYGTHQMRNIRLRLQASDFNINTLNDTMFFVYVIATGTPSADAPCGTTNPMIMGAVTNLYPLYQSMMKYVKQIENNCEIPKEFIDLSLRIKALELCIRTGNYPQAIKYWNKYFKNKIGTITRVTNCSCYG
jgi:hypothetical protein